MPPKHAGYAISPSRIRKADPIRGCLRQWGFGALFDQPEPTTKAQADGTTLHAIGENWIKHGTPPPDTFLGRLYKTAIPFLPKPGTTGVFTELPIEPLDIDGTWAMPGTADLVELQGDRVGNTWHKCVILYDYKTTAAEKYIPTIEQLKADEQPNLYGLALMRKFDAQYIRCMWLYLVKDKKRPHTIPREFTLTRTEAEAFWALARVNAKKLLDLSRNPPDNPYLLEPNWSACDKYRGCHYQQLCQQNQKESREMQKASLFDKLKKAPATTQTAGSPPTPGTLVFPTKTAAPVANGYTPPTTPARPSPLPSINPPEGAPPGAPLSASEQVVKADDPPKRKRRTKAEIEMERETRGVAAGVDWPAPPPSPQPTGFDQLVVCVDSIYTKAPAAWPKPVPLVEWAGDAMRDAAAEYQVSNWRLIDYKSAGALAYFFETWLSTNQPKGVVMVDSRTPEGAALLPVLEAQADLMIRRLA